MFSSSAQNLAKSAVINELNVEKVECGARQGDKVGASDVGQLNRIKDKVKLYAHSLCSCCAMLALKPC